MSEEKKESETTSIDDSQSERPSVEETTEIKSNTAADAYANAVADAELAAKAAESAELAAKEAIARAESAKEKAEAAAEIEYKAIAAEVKSETAKAPDYTFKRKGEEIFRREMGEPEFFLDKKDRFPRPILTADEQASLTAKAEMPQDQTPAYNPEHVLSPEFEGMSNYERGVDDFLEASKLNLETLKQNPESSEKQIQNAQDEITYLESLHENFYLGMNVFRTAKGGRDKIKA